MIDYYPFGSVRIDEKYTAYENDYKFTGYELDETGLNYAGARYYDSGVGRFVSVDPAHLLVGDSSFEQKYGRTLKQHLMDPQSLNSYSYVNNNPLKYTDPNGEILPLIGAAVVAYAPIWVPIAITGAAAVSAGVTAWFTGNAIVDTAKGDHQAALQSSNNAMSTLMVTEAVLGGIVGVEALVGRVGQNTQKQTLRGTRNPKVKEGVMIGQKAHSVYNPPGTNTRLNSRLPSGKRPDSYSIVDKYVRELKQNNCEKLYIGFRE